MRPILFTLFGYPVRSYGLFIAVGILAGIWLAQRIARSRRQQHVPLVEEFSVAAIVSAVLGARLWEVAFTWEYYSRNLWEIPQLWHGGLSIQGAVVGGLLGALWFTRSRRLSFWDFADTLTPGLLLGQAIGRLGSCLLNGDAYGKPTGTEFGLMYAPGTPAYAAFGPQRLWPAEVFEGLWDLAILGIVIRLLRRNPRPGAAFLVYVILYSLGRFALEFLRADSLTVLGLKTAQVSSLGFVLAAVLLLHRLYRRPTPAGRG